MSIPPTPATKNTDAFRAWLSSGNSVLVGKVILAISGLFLCLFGLGGLTIEADDEKYSDNINFLAEGLRNEARQQLGFGLALIGLSAIISSKELNK